MQRITDWTVAPVELCERVLLVTLGSQLFTSDWIGDQLKLFLGEKTSNVLDMVVSAVGNFALEAYACVVH